MFQVPNSRITRMKSQSVPEAAKAWITWTFACLTSTIRFRQQIHQTPTLGNASTLIPNDTQLFHFHRTVPHARARDLSPGTLNYAGQDRTGQDRQAHEIIHFRSKEWSQYRYCFQNELGLDLTILFWWTTTNPNQTKIPNSQNNTNSSSSTNLTKGEVQYLMDCRSTRGGWQREARAMWNVLECDLCDVSHRILRRYEYSMGRGN